MRGRGDSAYAKNSSTYIRCNMWPTSTPCWSRRDHALHRGGHLAGRLDDDAAGDGGALAIAGAVLNDIGR
jgi:hypothetical protein